MAGLSEAEYLRLRRRIRGDYPETEVVTEPERLFEIDKFRRQAGRPATGVGDAVRDVYTRRSNPDAEAARQLFNSQPSFENPRDPRAAGGPLGLTIPPDNDRERDSGGGLFNRIGDVLGDVAEFGADSARRVPSDIGNTLGTVASQFNRGSGAFLGSVREVEDSSILEAPLAAARGAVKGFRDPDDFGGGAESSLGQKLPENLRGVGGGVIETVFDPVDLLTGGTVVTDIARGVRGAAKAATPGVNVGKEIIEEADSASRSLISRIKTLQPLEAQNADLLSEFRGRQARGFAESVGQGEAGFRAGLAGLRGQSERVGFEPLRAQLDQQQVDSLFERVRQAGLGQFEHANAGEALTNILDGIVPQPSRTAQLERVFPGITRSMQDAGILKGPSWSEEVRDLVSLPQSMVSAFDLSGLRQVGTAAAGHPRMFAQNFKKSLQAAASEDTYRAFLDDIITRPTAPLRNAAEVAIQTNEQMLDAGSRTWAAKILDRIPGYSPSQRAFATLVNGMRADLFDSMVKSYGDEVPDAAELRRWGKLINASTGRGELPFGLSDTRVASAPVFWAPRLIASRVQMPFELFSSSAQVRKEAARQLVAFVGINSTIVGLGVKGGLWEGELDPRSADFGQIRIGPQRIDPWAGFRPIVNLTARLMTGERKSTITGEVAEVSEKQIIEDFLRSKLSPLTSAGVNIWTGKDALGNPYGAGNAAADTLTPLFFRELKEAAENAGPAGVARAALAGVGLGVNTYEPSPFDAAAARAGYDMPYVSLTNSQKQLVDDQNPELVDERSRQIIERGGPRGDYERLKIDLKAEQIQSDSLLAAGQMEPAEWRDQRADRQAQLRGAREVAFANAPDKEAKDAIGKFYDAIEANELADGSVDWNKVDAWVASQTPEDQKAISENTGLGGTETEREYRALIKELDGAGYFGIGDQSWATVRETAPPQLQGAVGPYETFGDWAQAVEQVYEEQLLSGGVPAGVAKEEAANALERHPIYKAYRASVDHYHKVFVSQHPNLMDKAIQWDLGSTDQAERQFLSQVLPSASAQ